MEEVKHNLKDSQVSTDDWAQRLKYREGKKDFFFNPGPKSGHNHRGVNTKLGIMEVQSYAMKPKREIHIRQHIKEQPIYLNVSEYLLTSRKASADPQSYNNSQ